MSQSIPLIQTLNSNFLPQPNSSKSDSTYTPPATTGSAWTDITNIPSDLTAQFNKASDMISNVFTGNLATDATTSVLADTAATDVLSGTAAEAGGEAGLTDLGYFFL